MSHTNKSHADKLAKVQALAARGATTGERQAANAALQRMQAAADAYRQRYAQHVPKAPDNSALHALQGLYGDAMRRRNLMEMTTIRAQIECAKCSVRVVVADKAAISPIYARKPRTPK